MIDRKPNIFQQVLNFSICYSSLNEMMIRPVIEKNIQRIFGPILTQKIKMADDEENNGKHVVFAILVKYNKT